MSSKEEIRDKWLYQKVDVRLKEAVDGAMSEHAMNECIAFQKWVRINWSISKGKYRHRGDFYKNSKLVDEVQLYTLYQQQTKQ